MQRNPYEVLGVSRTATRDEIRKSFLRLAHLHHPDKGGDAEKFKEISAAWNELKDKQQTIQRTQTQHTTSTYSWNPHFGFRNPMFDRAAELQRMREELRKQEREYEWRMRFMNGDFHFGADYGYTGTNTTA